MNNFVESVKNSTLLALSSTALEFTDRYELLHRLSSECKNINHLKLYRINNDDNTFVAAIHSFQCIESLSLTFDTFDPEPPEFCDSAVVSLVEHLPFLRNLEIGMYYQDPCQNRIKWTFILTLLRKYPHLEKITIVSSKITN